MPYRAKLTSEVREPIMPPRGVRVKLMGVDRPADAEMEEAP